jgi:glycerophosphoryl diester phosphodiesterase
MPASRILHRAGNLRDLLPIAGHPAVDAIEADVVVRGHDLVAHHDRPLGWLPLPLPLGERGPRLRHRDPVSLDELLRAVDGLAELVLDLRSWFNDPAPAVAAQLLARDDDSHVVVTCESWAVAERLLTWIPSLRVHLSVRSERQLRAFVRRRIAGELPRVGVAVRHRLLGGPAEVAALREHASSVTAWTVDDLDRARELTAWGVDAVVSNHLAILDGLHESGT